MSWTTDRAAIVSGLPSGYVNIPLNVEPDSEDLPVRHNHKAYSLKLGGVNDIEMLSGDGMNYSHTVVMRVIYTAVDGTQLITNEGLAMTLMQTISTLSEFHSFAEEPTIEELDPNHFIFNLVFHYGQEDNE